MKNKYNVAIIGIGRIGFSLENDKKREQPASHSRAFYKHKKVTLIAASDIDSEKLVQWKKRYTQARIYEDYREMLKNEQADIVVIAVNEEMHSEITMGVLEFRPALIVLEKPIAPTLKLAKEIENKAAKQNVPILINHERRYSKDYTALKQLLKQETIGDIHSIHAHLWSGMKAWTKGCEKDGACSLLHDGTHLIDIVHFLFDTPLTHPVIDKLIVNQEKEIESLFLHYDLSKKTVLYMEINGQKKYFGFEIQITGSMGRLIIGNGYFKLYKRKPSPYYSHFFSLSRDRQVKRPLKTRYFSNMVNNCIEFLDGNREIHSSLQDGIITLQSIQEIINILKK